MGRLLGRAVSLLLSLVLVVVLALAALVLAVRLGFSPFGVGSESHDSQVMRAVQRTQEVSLLRMRIDGITESKQERKFFGASVPGSGRKLYLRYRYAAKLGLDGAQVKVSKTGQHGYRVSVPRFKVMVRRPALRGGRRGRRRSELGDPAQSTR